MRAVTILFCAGCLLGALRSPLNWLEPIAYYDFTAPGLAGVWGSRCPDFVSMARCEWSEAGLRIEPVR